MTISVDARATKQPKVSVRICPRDAPGSASRDVRHSRYSQRPINTERIDRLASVYPHPLFRCRIELPQIVEVIVGTGRIEAATTEQPKIVMRIDPRNSSGSAARNVSRSGDTECPVDTKLVAWYRAAAADPRPLLRCGAVLPQVVRRSLGSQWIGLAATEQPQVPTAVCPGGSSRPAARHISGRSDTLSPVDAAGCAHIASAHPRPFVACGHGRSGATARTTRGATSGTAAAATHTDCEKKRRKKRRIRRSRTTQVTPRKTTSGNCGPSCTPASSDVFTTS